MTEIDTKSGGGGAGRGARTPHRNAPKLNRAPPFMSKPKAAGPDDLPIMQDDRVHWNGQPVAIVLAETQEQAEHAQTLIRVAYEEQTRSSRSPPPKRTEPNLACSWASH